MLGNKISLPTITAIACFLPASLFAQSWNTDASITFSQGGCDGSAAIQINDNTLLVANDETNVLHSFDLWGGAPIASFDIGSLLELHPQKPEIDFEAVAQGGDRLWWIGSHGRNKNGKKRPNRRMLFSTNIPSPDLSDIRVTSRQFDLIPAFRSHQELASILSEQVLKTAPKEGGLNIEGMAFSPDGRLMLGLRSPLTGKGGVIGEALLIYLSNENDAWSVSSFKKLSLGGGIRDMVWSNNQLFLIVGPVSSGGEFHIYSWRDDGKGPQIVSTPKFDSLRPEALVAIGRKLLVLSDDGGADRASADGKLEECKSLLEQGDLASVYFRGRALSMR